MTRLFAIVGMVCLGLAVYLHVEKWRENARLDQVIIDHQLRRDNARDTIIAVNRWVYANQGFRKNRNYFWIYRLGPTPTDILREGGDCSDKSRLVSAMLRRASIDSTLVMLFACEQCISTHTVVEARYEQGWMVVDPVFDIDFPAPGGNGKYFGVKELRETPSLLIDRVRDLGAQRGPEAKVNFYKLDTESYSHVRTINVDKNAATRTVAKAFDAIGVDLAMARRPQLSEDPIGLLRFVFMAATAGCLGLWALLRARRGHAPAARSLAAAP